MSEPKRLYRDTQDAVIAGVASGLAEYLNLDKTVVRVVFALLVVFTWIFPGVVVYLVLWLVIPPKPASAPPGPLAETPAGQPPPPPPPSPPAQ